MIVEVSGRMRRCTVCNAVFHFSAITQHSDCVEKQEKKENKPQKEKK
jgi:hypothetical protein